MAIEGMLFFALAELYCRFVLPFLGVSNEPVQLPLIEYVTRGTIPVIGVLAYTAMYFIIAGGFYFAYYEPPENQYLKDNKVQKDVKVRWSMSQPQATTTEVDYFWKSISTSVKGCVSVGFICNWNHYILQGKTRIYWDATQRSVLEVVGWWLVAYILVDLGGYVVHRVLHWPWLYVRVHKLHHFWKSPTPFVVSALHPFEILSLTSMTMMICASLPLWWPTYIFLIGWIYFYNTMDHSGVTMPSLWKWQAPVKFHDDHHKYFHVNYGPMVDWWDKLFGSYLKEEEASTQKFNEDTFHNHWATTPGVRRRAAASGAKEASSAAAAEAAAGKREKADAGSTTSGTPPGSDDEVH
mmetsp:Transcript_59465/g.134233  ORF Transcript_59465/g.134233 Transcript_59465/m.134233 type:complete len:352 (+) Transcript_59465:1-1056(+)